MLRSVIHTFLHIPFYYHKLTGTGTFNTRALGLVREPLPATGSLLEVLTSPAGSWTIIVTVPGGPTCLVSSGEGWRDAPIQLAKEPAV